MSATVSTKPICIRCRKRPRSAMYKPRDPAATSWDVSLLCFTCRKTVLSVSTCARCCKTRYIHRDGLCGPCLSRSGEAARKDREPPLPTKQPAEPTSARPGTEEKILALAARVERGEHLWHPDDAKLSLSREAELAARPEGEPEPAELVHQWFGWWCANKRAPLPAWWKRGEGEVHPPAGK